MADLTGMMQAAAGAAGGGDNLFIEDVFSCFLYTGTGVARTITNGIDIDGEGGLVWLKERSGGESHGLFDTLRGAKDELQSANDGPPSLNPTTLTAFTSSGFTVGTNGSVNGNLSTYVSWTFRKAPKFFDVVTYTGTGANRTVAHNLDSVPGSVWVKRTDTTGNWQVYHRANTANPETDFLILNTTAATADSDTRWNDTLPTDTVFTVGTEATVNASGGTYVAYLFAHDDGGFGDDGTENVITCGSYTGNGSATGPTITLGYEPQWLIIKRATTSGEGWVIIDNMRGMDVNTSGTGDKTLFANTSDAEGATKRLSPTATGFVITDNSGEVNTNGATYIFIAIRRGPMKTPTAGTEVFSPITSSDATGTIQTTGFPIDLQLSRYRSIVFGTAWADRLRGVITTPTDATSPSLLSSDTSAEATNLFVTRYWDNTSFQTPAGWAGNSVIFLNFRRAPGYFDVVCYTGTGANRTVNHNLGVIPELVIVKCRTDTRSWDSYSATLGGTKYLLINSTAAEQTSSLRWNDTNPTSSVFSLGTSNTVNGSGETYVAYLFASLAGVQDIGSYTGNGTSLTVTTGFQPRFIMVKRTDSTGNWIVGDSARGLVAGDDPFSFLNTTAVEVTDQDWVDVSATGFTVNETGANANVNAGVYLYWVIS